MEPFRRLIRFLFDIAIRGAATSGLSASGVISEHKWRRLMIKKAQTGLKAHAENLRLS